MENFLPPKIFPCQKNFFLNFFFFKSWKPIEFGVLNWSLGPSGSSNQIKSGKNKWEQCFFSTNISVENWIFFANWVPKKASKCWNPTNITPWECYLLYSKSTSPIKVTKSYGEQLFLDKRAKNIFNFHNYNPTSLFW